MANTTIIYTHTDEAPALATASLLPIIETFVASAHISIEIKNISLSARTLALFPEHLSPAQQQSDDLATLGQMTKNPHANIIKLPNISASVPQLKATIQELQQKGYKIPD